MLPNSLMLQTSALPLACVQAGGHKTRHLRDMEQCSFEGISDFIELS